MSLDLGNKQGFLEECLKKLEEDENTQMQKEAEINCDSNEVLLNTSCSVKNNTFNLPFKVTHSLFWGVSCDISIPRYSVSSYQFQSTLKHENSIFKYI